MHMHDFERERFSRALRISESYMVRTASSRKRSCNIGGMVGNVLNHQLQSAFERRVCPSSQLATLAWMSADSLLWILPRILVPLSQEDSLLSKCIQKTDYGAEIRRHTREKSRRSPSRSCSGIGIHGILDLLTSCGPNSFPLERPEARLTLLAFGTSRYQPELLCRVTTSARAQPWTLGSQSRCLS